MNYRLELVAKPHKIVRQIILSGLTDFNRTALMPDLQVEDLAVVIRHVESKEILGGLWGRTGWEWLTIEYVFVPETLRGRGLATRLIEMAEDEAAARGCHSAWLDTLNREALKLYERLGYERFGELKEYPKGGSRFFLQKRLTKPAAA